MAEGKKGFVLYADYRGVICKLTDVKAGRLFKHIMMYVNDENPVTEDEVIELVFEPIKQQLKRDLEKWKHKSEVRSELGKQGGLKSGEKRRQSKQNEANEAIASNLKQNEQVTVNVNVTGNVNDTIIPKDRLDEFMIENLNEENQRWRENFCLTCSAELKDIPEILKQFNAHVRSMGENPSTMKEYRNYITRWRLNKKSIESKNINVIPIQSQRKDFSKVN